MLPTEPNPCRCAKHASPALAAASTHSAKCSVWLMRCGNSNPPRALHCKHSCTQQQGTGCQRMRARLRSSIQKTERLMSVWPGGRHIACNRPGNAPRAASRGPNLQQQGCGALWQTQTSTRTACICAAGSPAAAGLWGADTGVAGLLADCLCRSSSCLRVAACASRSDAKSAPSASAC